MDILIFVLVVSHLNLVISEETLAIEKSVAPEDGYKVHPEENDFADDQLAESSQTVTRSYENADNLKEYQSIGNSVQSSNDDVTQHGLRQSSVTFQSPIQVLQQGSQKYDEQQTHQLYLQQYPTQQVHIFNAEAAALQQPDGSKGPQILGYSSYVEHPSAKDEEEMKSALQEGSVSDIKRLVPKSGISFTIYHNGKNTETQSAVAPLNHLSHYSSSLQQKIRGDSPATQLRVQSEVHQSPSLEELHSQYEDHVSGNSQQLLQSHRQTQQSRNPQTVYYTQPETHKNYARVTVKPQLKINVAESNFNEQPAEYQNIKSSIKSSKQNFVDVENQKYLSDKGFQRVVKPVKNLETVHYGIDPVAQTEGNKRVTYSQTHSGGNGYYSKLKKENSFLDTSQKDSGKYISSSFPVKANLGGHLPQLDKKLVLNRLSGNYINSEELKPGHIVNHLGIAAYAENAYKGDRFAATDSETAKTTQQGIITHVPYVETKNSQTFDHQKALEGSTSFDIKNAIDSSGALLHQTNYQTPAADIHSGDLQKQQIAYIIPKIPTSAVVIDNSVHEPAGGHQIKDFGHAGISPQVLYHNEGEVGKFFYPPQTLQWASGIKQGTPVYTKDLHQQILKLQLPKEEVFVKTPHVEFPSVVSHVPHSQQKPLLLHYELPFPSVVKSPQEVHFQPNTKTRFQTSQYNHFKMPQPVTLDWSLFKSGIPNIGINSLSVKPEISAHVQESGKKIVPILVRKRKNRSNNKEVGVVYGKVTAGRRPSKPNHRQEKNVRVNLLPEASNVKQFETKGDRKNEFSVSASYKVDRSSSS